MKWLNVYFDIKFVRCFLLFFLSGLAYGVVPAPTSLFENAIGIAKFQSLELQREWVLKTYELRLEREPNGVFDAWKEIEVVFGGLGMRGEPKAAHCLLDDLDALDSSSFLLIPIRTNELIPDQTYLTIGRENNEFVLIEYDTFNVIDESELFAILSERLLNSYMVLGVAGAILDEVGCDLVLGASPKDKEARVDEVRVSSKSDEYSVVGLAISGHKGIFAYSILGDLNEIVKVAGSCSCFLGYDQVGAGKIDVYFDKSLMPKPAFELFVDIYYRNDEQALKKLRVTFSGRISDTQRFIFVPDTIDFSDSVGQQERIFTIYDRRATGEDSAVVNFLGYEDAFHISELDSNTYSENLRLPFYSVGSFSIRKIQVDKKLIDDDFITVQLTGNEFKEERVLRVEY